MGNAITDQEREDLFGHIAFVAQGGGQVQLLGGWEEKNITTVYVPALDGVPTDSGLFSGRVRWNRRCVEQLQHAWADAQVQGLMAFVKTWDGSFNARLVRGSRTRLSNHAYGTAFDINAEWNGFGENPAAPGEEGDLHPLAKCFAHHGFVWGGDWAHKDGMHFEVFQLLDYSDEPETKIIVSDDWKDAIAARVVDGIAYASGSALSELVGDVWDGKDRMVPAAQFLRAHGFLVKWNQEQNKVYAYKV